jgi:hypothetical protein
VMGIGEAMFAIQASGSTNLGFPLDFVLFLL